MKRAIYAVLAYLTISNAFAGALPEKSSINQRNCSKKEEMWRLALLPESLAVMIPFDTSTPSIPQLLARASIMRFCGFEEERSRLMGQAYERVKEILIGIIYENSALCEPKEHYHPIIEIIFSSYSNGYETASISYLYENPLTAPLTASSLYQEIDKQKPEFCKEMLFQAKVTIANFPPSTSDEATLDDIFSDAIEYDFELDNTEILKSNKFNKETPP